MERKLLWKYLESAVKRCPNKPFLYFKNQKITYKELDEISDKLAYSFTKMGLSRGDNIAVVALNQPEWLYTFFAATKIGVGVVALNVRYRGARVRESTGRKRALIKLKV